MVKKTIFQIAQTKIIKRTVLLIIAAIMECTIQIQICVNAVLDTVEIDAPHVRKVSNYFLVIHLIPQMPN